MLKEKATKSEERALYKKRRKEIKIKNTKRAIVCSMIIMQQCDRARFGDRYDELDRVSDLGRDEFPQADNHAFDVLAMEENRLIDKHTRTKNKFNSDNNSKIINGAIFSQVGNTSEDKKNQSVKNNNG